MANDFEQQKKDAEERVREMNRRYQTRAGIPHIPGFVTQRGNTQEKSSTTTDNAPPRKATDLLKMLKLDGLKGDPDRLLLLGLFLLLNSEETDEWLLYALLYIMM